MSIVVGLKGRCDLVVAQEHTALAAGSGLVPVFATPHMIALMERAAYTSLLPHLGQEEGSVGTHLNVTHSAATPVGMKVWAESVVTHIEGRKITFAVHAYDEQGEIGSGTHIRFLIHTPKFLDKAEARKHI